MHLDLRALKARSASGTDLPQTTLQVTQKLDTSADGIRLTRVGKTAAYTQWIDTVARFNIGYSNPATSDPASSFVTLTQAGNVGIGTDSPAAPLEISDTGPGAGQVMRLERVNNGDKGQLHLSIDPDENTVIYKATGSSPSSHVFLTGNTESARFDTSGRLLIGTDTSLVSKYSGSSFQPGFQNVSVSGTGGFFRYSNNNDGAALVFNKSRNTTIGSQTIVNENETLGYIGFTGSDGTQFQTAASINAATDGTPGTNDMPGRLSFSTTANGASSPTERMRIRSDGGVSLGGAGAAYQTLGINGELQAAFNLYEVVSVRGQFSAVMPAANTFVSSPTVNLPKDDDQIGNLRHFQANAQPTPTKGTIGSQFGFICEANLTAANNNFGFYSDIAAGSGRWNFYAQGDAYNYFKGETYFLSTNRDGINAGTTAGKYINSNGVLVSCMNSTDNLNHYLFNNTNGIVGSIGTSGSSTVYNTSSDYRLKENIIPMTGAADRVKALKPCRFNFKADADKTVDGFLAHEAQEVVPESVTGTKDATEAIGTLFDWDGKVREENVTEPAELTYSEEVIDDPGQEGKEAVYSEPVLIQEYQPAVYGEPELISPATEPVIGPMGRVIQGRQGGCLRRSCSDYT